jgi:hypothetical protein
VTRRAILVLGMHRSGTSALAGLLVHLGVQGPKTLMEANEYNERGYWESARFHEYHDRLLQAAGTEWDLWTKVTLDGLDPQVARQFDVECQSLLAQEFGDAPLFVMKDPRVCRLVPFWQRQLAAAGVEPTAILTVRSPIEVAKSLAVRDGLGLEHALLLWLRHVLDAEASTRAIRRSVVRYRDLLENWKQVERQLAADLDLPLAGESPDTDARVAGFLTSDLRHHLDRREPLPVTPLLADWIDNAYNALEALVGPKGAHAGAIAAFDQIRREFDRGSAAFGPHVDEERRARRRVTLGSAEGEHSLAVAERQRDEAEHRVAVLNADLAELRRQHHDLTQDIARLSEDHRAALRAADLTRQELSARVNALSAALEAGTRRVHDLEQSRTWRWTRPIRLVARQVYNLANRLRR